jgi:hypothetical protein
MSSENAARTSAPPVLKNLFAERCTLTRSAASALRFNVEGRRLSEHDVRPGSCAATIPATAVIPS